MPQSVRIILCPRPLIVEAVPGSRSHSTLGSNALGSRTDRSQSPPRDYKMIRTDWGIAAATARSFYGSNVSSPCTSKAIAGVGPVEETECCNRSRDRTGFPSRDRRLLRLAARGAGCSRPHVESRTPGACGSRAPTTPMRGSSERPTPRREVQTLIRAQRLTWQSSSLARRRRSLPAHPGHPRMPASSERIARVFSALES